MQARRFLIGQLRVTCTIWDLTVHRTNWRAAMDGKGNVENGGLEMMCSLQ